MAMKTYSFILSIDDHIGLITSLRESLLPLIEKVAGEIGQSIQKGNKVLLIGNGGSAADAQHIAAEFTGRFVKERRPLPAIALTTDTSALTAIANDYGYQQVFARQVAALGQGGDILIAISTSGNSPSILEAVEVAKEKGIKTIGLTGKDGGTLGQICDMHINIPHQATARVQEMHILIGHLLCEYVDSLY
ncbi:D-sedoheptulose 7-phosphate isomerase [Olivibacter sitiensis]|uniref:D-sedoheptulose 7-phosphate isomerase n=1 Tax=Olivibacter sitiensis TaxID=376470 RepID=UPI000485AEDC|nr:D-sedoheptulose 7-phosphate isomerase [Olivibacter sitiensis]